MRRTSRRRRPVVLRPARPGIRERAVTRRAATIGVVGALAASGALVGDSIAAAPAVGATGGGSSVPHVMVVMMENEGYGQVVGSTTMPYTKRLVAQSGLATSSYALTHPSLPNYLDLVSGSNQGVTSDEPPSSSGVFGVPTLATQLAAAGIPAAYYAENLPGDPSADSGTYVVHHNPWEYFSGGPTVKDPGNNGSTMLAALDASSPPDFVWFTPNVVDDGDGESGTTALHDEDNFLSEFVPAVQATPWYADGGQIVIEWDESLDSDTSGIDGGDGGHIPTIVVSEALASDPQTDATPVDTAGVLRSIEQRYGLGFLGAAANAANGNIDALLDATAVSRVITVTGTDQADVGSSVTLEVSASGSPTPSIRLKGHLPSGLRFHRGPDATATISGTPRSKAAGAHSLVLTATYGHGRSKVVVTDAFTFTVLSATTAVHGRRR